MTHNADHVYTAVSYFHHRSKCGHVVGRVVGHFFRPHDPHFLQQILLLHLPTKSSKERVQMTHNIGATAMTYEVHANRKPWRFATEAEARAAANDIFNRKGVVVAITQSNKPATHRYAA
jgi:hypothetical protein